jgi:predicted transcriptional regulator
MEVELSPELQAKLDRIASQQGRDSKSLVHEAVERLVGYDEWFICQVETGWHKSIAAKVWSTKMLSRAWKASSLKNSAGPDARSLDSGGRR